MGDWLFLNGDLIQEADATLRASDRGLLSAYGLFETMRSYGGRVFRMYRHYDRLCIGARVLEMEAPLTAAALADAIRAVLERNRLADARLRLTVTAGAEERAAVRARCGPQVMITARALTEYPPSLYRRGMAGATSRIRRNDTSPLCRVKSLNYLENLLARNDARRAGANEAILLNTRGFVAEGNASNVFVVRGDRLLTPPVSSGALPGVAREAVLELASAAGLEAAEADLEPETLAAADEAFLTNSVMEVMPLTSLDGCPIGDGRPGPVTRRILTMYQELARAETQSP